MRVGVRRLRLLNDGSTDIKLEVDSQKLQSFSAAMRTSLPTCMRTAVALIALLAPGASLRVGRSRVARPGTALELYAPRGSPYVQRDADETGRDFDDFPESYEPNPAYEGTCVPGMGRENRPLADLTLETSIAPHAFFEAPFHARWPAHHPSLLSPAERLEAAGRFVDDDDEDLPENKKRRGGGRKKKTAVETVDREAEQPTLAEEKDPLFDDSSSKLLDAALGLDDDDDDENDPAAAPAADTAPGDFLLD